ncbi:MAG: MotA/TolQ/ExbB proton channel family protein [Planctomycetota bacterium]
MRCVSTWRRWIPVLCLTVLVLSILVPLAVTWAGDAAPAAGGGGEGETSKKASLLTIIGYGGIVGHSIILLSVVGMALIIEAFMNIKREKLVPPELLAEIENMFEAQEYEKVLEVCQAHESFIAKIIAAGLSRLSMGYDAMSEAMGAVGEEEATKIYQKIGWINLIATIAPLLGLFGTVTGMMVAFNTIASSVNVNPGMLAAGIFQALVTTVEGLTVSIPYGCVYFAFKNKVDRYIMEIGIITGELMDRFKGQETKA